MPTQVIDRDVASHARLERRSANGNLIERTELTAGTFTIGRLDSADLQVDSQRVSREHVVILTEGEDYSIRDLGSTNGTLLNGKTVAESKLQDGDIITVGDTEFVFCAPAESQRAQTLVMTERIPSESPTNVKELIYRVRRMQEVILDGSICVAPSVIYDEEHRQIMGLRARANQRDYELTSAGLLGLDLKQDGRWSRHFQRLFRRSVLKKLSQLEVGQQRLLLAIETNEASAVEKLHQILFDLSSELAESMSLVLEVPANVECARNCCQALASHDGTYALRGFHGKHLPILDEADSLPSEVVLSPVVIKAAKKRGKHLKQSEQLVRRCQEAGCRTIAIDVGEADAELCRALGITWFIRENSRLPGPNTPS